MRSQFPAGLALAALAFAPTLASAQVRASERGGVFQVVNGTTITVDYSRPSVRDRAAIFGGQVPWGTVWTPGANWATTLEVDHDVTLNGHPVRKGKYSVWMEVQPAEWTVILDPRAKMFHTAHPKPDSAQIRFQVAPTDGTGPNLLTWSFTAVAATATTLQMAWAGKSVALEVGVQGPDIPALAAGVADRYAGTYTTWWQSPSRQSEVRLVAGPGQVTGTWTGAPFSVWSNLRLVPISDNWFHPGAVVNGSLYDIVTDLVFEFTVVDGKATGFDIRGPNDNVVGHGTRIP